MQAQGRPAALPEMTDDDLATAAVSLAISELQWTPDVAPAVMDRISRDAIAYPEQFDHRQVTPAPPPAEAPVERSARRTVGRIAVISLVLVAIVVLVLLVATASAVEASPALERILIIATENA